MLNKKLSCSVICLFMAVLMVVLSALSPVGAISDKLTTEDTPFNLVTNNSIPCRIVEGGRFI